MHTAIRRILWALLLVASAARPAFARAAREGSVAYVVNGAVYLDRGAQDGLTRGAVLKITRANIPVAEVRIVDVADDMAVAQVLQSSSPPRANDTFKLPAAPATRASAPVTAPPQRAHVAIAERDLAAAWSTSLSANPPAPLPYDKTRAPAATSRGYAATVFAARSASGLQVARRHEQLAYMRFRADHLGLAGLSMRTRGMLDLRYDPEPDRYLPGRQAVPLVHELAFHYETAEPGFSSSLGRFLPVANFAGKIDGAELAAAGKTVTLTGYGGFKPSMQSLAPQNDPVAGVAVILAPESPASPWSLTTGYMREYARTSLSRQAVAVDSHASIKNKVFLAETAMIDLPLPGATGAKLADFNVHGSSPLNAKTTVSTGFRYNSGRIYALEAAQFPQEWLPYFQDRSQARFDADTRYDMGRFGAVRPYMFWLREISRLEPFSRITALGLAYHLENILGYQLALDIDGDYGDGTRRQVDFRTTLSSTGPGWFGWTVGNSNHWTFGPDTGIHTFLNTLRLGTFARLSERLRLTLDGHSALGSALTSTPAPLTSWHRGEAGVSYVW